MSRMQNEESLIAIRRARFTRVLARALALTIVALAVSHAGCGDAPPPCPDIPGVCAATIPSDKWQGPLGLWQGPTEKFFDPVNNSFALETKRQFYPLDYDPKQDVALHTCPLCTCAPADYCYGGAVWTGYRYDCANISGQKHDVWAEALEGICYEVDISFGGNVACLGTLKYPNSPCAPVKVSEPSLPAPTPEHIAVSYASNVYDRRACENPDNICVPPMKDGYELCIAAQGDVPCEGEWAEAKRYVFAEGFDDLRDCNNVCACGQQKGSTCKAEVDAFADDKCKVLVETGQVTGELQTVAIDPPAPINSLFVTVAEYVPGTCDPPVGNTQTEPVGEIKLGPRVTFCCL